MKITKYIHSCLLVENGADRILFDPGKFSFAEGLVDPEVFTDVSAIIVTHKHPDHMDDAAFKRIVGNNPAVTIYANGQIGEYLSDRGIEAEEFSSGERFVGGTSIAAVGARHAAILADDIPQNVAYIVADELLVPGDSFDASLLAFKGIRVLALPIMAPWTTELQVAAFAELIGPEHIIPIHDGFAKDFFVEMRHQNFEKHFARKGIQFYSVNKPGAVVEIV